ncbi:hypothetical protein [Polymorphospora rubra]|uniref:hypothetical protein n=1 Tax=Polymorphospora rubra TaxID=338584 RepID=UPI00340E5FDE
MALVVAALQTVTRPYQQLLHRLGIVSEIDQSRAVVDSISVRAQEGRRTSTGPEAYTSGGYRHHLRLQDSHSATVDRHLLEDLLDALADYPGTSLVRACSAMIRYGRWRIG